MHAVLVRLSGEEVLILNKVYSVRFVAKVTIDYNVALLCKILLATEAIFIHRLLKSAYTTDYYAHMEMLLGRRVVEAHKYVAFAP